MKIKYLAHSMVFGKVTNDGDFMPPIIFPNSLKLKTEAFIK